MSLARLGAVISRGFASSLFPSRFRASSSVHLPVSCPHLLLPRFSSSISSPSPKEKKTITRGPRLKNDAADILFVQSVSPPASMIEVIEQDPKVVEEMEAAASEPKETAQEKVQEEEEEEDEEESTTPEQQEAAIISVKKPRQSRKKRKTLAEHQKYPYASRIVEDWLHDFEHPGGWIGGKAAGGVDRIRGYGFRSRVRASRPHGVERVLSHTRIISDEDYIQRVLDANDKLDIVFHSPQIRRLAAFRALFAVHAWRLWKSFNLGLARNTRFPIVDHRCTIVQMCRPNGIAFALVDATCTVDSLLKNRQFHAKLNPEEHLHTAQPLTWADDEGRQSKGRSDLMTFLLHRLPSDSGYKLQHVNRINLDCRLENLRIVPFVEDEAEKQRLMKEYKLPSTLLEPLPSNERIVESIEEYFSFITQATDSLIAIGSWEAQFALAFVQEMTSLKEDLLERARKTSGDKIFRRLLNASPKLRSPLNLEDKKDRSTALDNL